MLIQHFYKMLKKILVYLFREMLKNYCFNILEKILIQKILITFF
jgi:hypothetical protein